MILHNPLLGVGSRTFGEHAPEYGEISHDNRGKNAHNTFIDAASTSGLVGVGAFIAMLLGALRELLRPTARIASTWERNMRKATMIAILTMIFRAQFDAKEWDWSFYILCTIAGISGAMMKSRSPPPEIADEPQVEAAPALPATNKLTF